MARGPAIVIRDKGFSDFFRRLKRLGGRPFTVTVGVHEDEGPHPSANARGQELMTMARLAAIHEFGVDAEGVSIPERSFLRSWFDAHGEDARKAIEATTITLITGSEDERRALERLAQGFAAGVQEQISRGIPPPNAQSTIDRKGSSKPLIDTGQLRQSIRGKVHR